MEADYRQRRDMILENLGRLKQFHQIQSDQWSYNDQLSGECGLPASPRGPERLYKHVWTIRRKGLFRYKDAIYLLTEDHDDIIVVKEY